MTDFVFDDFSRTMLGGARNVADAAADGAGGHLKSSGPGLDGATSYTTLSCQKDAGASTRYGLRE